MTAPITPYHHQVNKRSRSLRLKVDQTGKVIISTPPGYSKKIIDDFVKQNQAWIEKTLAKVAQQKLYSEDETQIYIFGKKYQKKITHNPEDIAGAKLAGQELIINLPHILKNSSSKTNTTEAAAKATIRFLKKVAQNYIVTRTQQWAAVMETTYRSLEFRQQKTRWGSCSSTGTLSFNWRLVHAPPKVIDYVIIHELAHRTHMNHSSSFWNLVSKFDPDYPRHRGWLKRHGVSAG